MARIDALRGYLPADLGVFMYEMENELKSEENEPYVDAQAKWCVELKAAHKETQDFHERGDKIIQHYSEDRKVRRARKYPLFNANVGILENALFARIPRPDVARRFKDPDDQVGRVASLILERALVTELEGVGGGFKATARALIKDLLVPGAGFARVRYEAEVDEMSVTSLVDEQVDNLPTAPALLKDQRTPIDYVHWKDVRWSPCRVPGEMRWQAFRAYLNESAATKRFGEKAKWLSFNTQHKDYSRNNSTDNETENNIEPQAEVWEIWDKQEGQVVFICETCPMALDIRRDPLGLPDFFPAPAELLVSHTTNERLLPVADFTILQDQYNELNEVNNRISRLVRACRLAGVYDSAEPGVKMLLEGAAEHQLVPIKNWDDFAGKGGMKGAVDFMPLDAIVATLQQLERQREAIKQQIYELTGISDIVRGTSSPYETAAAQGMKAQYASIRLQGKQSDVAQYLTSLIQRKAFLMLKFYEPQRLMERCGALPEADQQHVPAAIALLQNELMSNLKLEISTDALQQPNWARDQAEKAQTITALSQLMSQALPAAREVPQLGPLFLHIIKWAMAGNPGSREIEGVIENGLMQVMQAAQEPPAEEQQQPDPAMLAMQAKQQADAQRQEFEQQKAIETLNFEREKFMQEMQFEREKFALEMELNRDRMLNEGTTKVQIEQLRGAQKQMPQAVNGNIGLDEDRMMQVIGALQQSTIEAISAMQQSTISTITQLANQPAEPAVVRVTRDETGALVGTIQ